MRKTAEIVYTDGDVFKSLFGFGATDKFSEWEWQGWENAAYKGVEI